MVTDGPSDASAEAETAAAWDVRAGRRWRKSGLGLILLCIVAAAAYWPVSERWAQRRDASFKSRCQAAVESENWSELREVAGDWRDRSPGNGDALVFLAEAAVQLDEPELAVASLGDVPNDYHGVLEALMVRGEILIADLNRVYDAEQTWLRMLNVNEGAAVAHQRLIYFYAMTLQRRKLIDAIYRSMNARCEPPEAYSYLVLSNALNFSDGLTRVTRWRQANPDDEVLEVAQAIYASQQTADNSIATFGRNAVMPGDRGLVLRCLEKYPANLEILAEEIDLAMFNGDDARVAKLLGQAPPSAEQDSRFWRARGWLLERRGKREEAAASLERSIELVPCDWQSRWLLADVYRKLNRSAEAEVMAQVAQAGKDLQRTLLEQPTARDLNEELAERIAAYLADVGDAVAMDALTRRM